MNFYALISGIIIVTLIIAHFKRSRLEKSQLAYPLLLASFPLYYFVFAIYANDIVALQKEFVVGTVFFALAFIAIKSKIKLSATLVGIGSISHAIYDHYHNILFINPGTPSWWLEFCGSIDLILGVYLFYFAITTPNKSFKRVLASRSAT